VIWPLVLASALALACSSPREPSPSSCDTGAVREPIVGGSRAERALGLSPEELNSLVAVRVIIEGDPSWCSGAVVADGLAITARHCVESETGAAFALELLFGHDTRDAAAIVAVESYEAHPELDVAVVRFQPPSVLAVRPVPLLRDAPNEDWIGSPAELAGYGWTELDAIGERRFAVEHIDSYDDTYVVVAGNEVSGACTGDSGGPLYGRSDDGRLSVLGILDQGDPSCVGLDYYTRADAIAAWLGPAASTGPGGSGCEGITPAGSCWRGRALWCAGNELRAQPCDAGQACGWSTEAAGFRCVAKEREPCVPP
jgi:hypothetical protein